MTHSLDYRIRYLECDQQGVVFNAWYQAYMDDAVDCWLRELDPWFEQRGWEVMVKASRIVWESPARFGDVLTLDLAVGRWGTTSLDVVVVGAVGERAVFDGTITYVVVDREEQRPRSIPDDLRAHLSA